MTLHPSLHEHTCMITSSLEVLRAVEMPSRQRASSRGDLAGMHAESSVKQGTDGEAPISGWTRRGIVEQPETPKAISLSGNLATFGRSPEVQPLSWSSQASHFGAR